MEAEKGDSREGEGESPERHEALHTHARTQAGTQGRQRRPCAPLLLSPWLRN